MKTIIFICHGNICRSVAAEYIAKDLDHVSGNIYYSRAVSNEERGNDIYPPMKQVLIQNNIHYDHHASKRITLEEYRAADIIFCMDHSNINYLTMLFPYENRSKIKLLDKQDIEDPWYTGNYVWVFHLIKEAIEEFLHEENII